MTDRKPPRVVDDERGTLITLLQFQRESLVRKVTGVDDAAARQSPVASGTTLLWLINHMATAESLWIVGRFAGGEPVAPEHDTLDAAVTTYRDTWASVDAIVSAAPTLDEPCRGLEPNESPANLRWVLMHLLEETARHAGHADILRELIDGQTGR